MEEKERSVIDEEKKKKVNCGTGAGYSIANQNIFITAFLSQQRKKEEHLGHLA